MKTLLYPAIALAAFFSFSCACSQTTKDEGHDESEVTPTTEIDKPVAGTYTFIVSPMKGKWEAGDKIFIHGSYAPAAETITLSDSEISTDGKTATARLDQVTEYLSYPDNLYAVWPAEAVFLKDGLLGSDTEISDPERLLAAAYLKENSFAFADASSPMTFTVDGNFDSFAIAGNDRAGLRLIDFTIDYTSATPYFSKPRTDGYPFLYGELVPGQTVTLWFPGGISFKSGFTLYFAKEGVYTHCYEQKEKIQVEAGKELSLGNISSELTVYDGPYPKMPEMGKSTKYKVSFNELSGLCLSADADFLWGVGDNGDLAKLSFEGNVIEKMYIGGDSEAVTRNPVTGDLLIGLEPNGVGIVAAPDFNTKVKTLFSIADAKGYGNAGLEGLTYYKDGLVYAGTQTGSDLFCCNLETGEVVWKKRLREIFPAITEIADLCYDPLTDWLWIIDSESKKFFALTGDAESLLGAYSVLTISNPESIFVDHVHSCIWIGDDYGSTSYLYRYDFNGLDAAIVE